VVDGGADWVPYRGGVLDTAQVSQSYADDALLCVRPKGLAQRRLQHVGQTHASNPDGSWQQLVGSGSLIEMLDYRGKVRGRLVGPSVLYIPEQTVATASHIAPFDDCQYESN
jgi:hypothetical protein